MEKTSPTLHQQLAGDSLPAPPVDAPSSNSSHKSDSSSTTNDEEGKEEEENVPSGGVVPTSASLGTPRPRTVEVQPRVQEPGTDEEAGDDDFYNSTSSALTEERWEEMFKRLIEFKDMHGHCLVPNRYKEDLQLGAWVTAQRKHYKLLQAGSGKSTPLNPERLDRLVDVGFEWTAKNPRHLMWEVRYSELKDFKKTYGHAQVPIGWEQNVQLANWVSTQRQEYKNLIKGKTSRLNNQRVGLLNSVGFAWELQRGGRRRRLTVASPPSRPNEPRPPHPADAEEEGEDGTPRSNKRMRSDDDEDTTGDSFPIDDGSSPLPMTPSGRRRTTLKKKVVPSPEGSSRCILPGVAILGGGRDGAANRPTPNRKSRRGGGGASAALLTPERERGESPNTMMMMEAQALHHQQQQQQQAAFVNAASRGNNEALLRALGGNPHGATHPWQMMANGAYQFANPFAANHLMMAGAGNPFFPMAANPFGMNPFAAGGAGQFGMDPRQFGGGGPESEAMMMGMAGMGSPAGGRGAQDQMRPFDVSSMGPESMGPDSGQPLPQHFGGGGMGNMGGGGSNQQQFGGGVPFQNGMQMGGSGGQQGGGPFWGMGGDNAAAAAAAQHLHAAAALTAGVDERALPAHLAPLANAARRMNDGGGGGPGGNRNDMHGGRGGGGPNRGGRPASPISSSGRGRRADPPADAPSDGYGGPMPMSQGRGMGGGGNPQMKMRNNMFEDADEE